MKKKKPKIKPHELAELLHDLVEEERSIKIKKQQKVSKLLYELRRAVTIPIIIGIIAAIAMWRIFGGLVLAEALLSWTIGLTLLVAIVTLLKRIDNN